MRKGITFKRALNQPWDGIRDKVQATVQATAAGNQQNGNQCVIRGQSISKAILDKDLGDKLFSWWDQSSWTSHEDSDLDAGKKEVWKTSCSEVGSEMSIPGEGDSSEWSQLPGQFKSGRAATVWKKKKRRSPHIGSPSYLQTSMAPKDLYWDYSATLPPMMAPVLSLVLKY
ncbi:hypothetical protein NDU88_004740 [Pleurodeles waltl]|uniref:Uncharacterized protein n=1 Tax=Pleurodeles waltl TaxID=8319 RepID=A0AAV7SJS4_PLEWA|nr:hypothetical protein NDU88_004740 [Pleurodeles waltl]